MKVLVTGANGFTGSHLCQRLLARGDQVIAYVRRTSDLSRLNHLAVEFAYGDITDLATLAAAMQGIDLIFHTAAYVELGLVDANRMEQINVGGTKAVLTAAQTTGVAKMVYCSTIGVYGDTQGRLIDETFERQQTDFSSAYDRTKYLAQQAVDAAAKEGFPVVSIMPSGIFGPGDPHFGKVVQLFLKGGLKVWAGAGRMTGIVHVDDLVDAMILASEQSQPGEHYIISTGELTTGEMFQVFSDETGIAPPIEIPEPMVRLAGNILDPVGRLLNWQPPLSRERVHYLYDRCVRVSSAKARAQLGWQPRSVQETLRDLVQQ
jgi:dihydroflavonol-4-reductase